MTFKEHRISELVREKGHVEAEVQQLLDKLALEVEKNTRLSSELQEGHVGREKYVRVMNENSNLQGKLQSQLKVHKRQMEETETAMITLLKRQATDETAISGLMTTVQELRSANAVCEAKTVSLRQEVEESRKEMQKTATKMDQLVRELCVLACLQCSAHTSREWSAQPPLSLLLPPLRVNVPPLAGRIMLLKCYILAKFNHNLAHPGQNCEYQRT